MVSIKVAILFGIGVVNVWSTSGISTVGPASTQYLRHKDAKLLTKLPIDLMEPSYVEDGLLDGQMYMKVTRTKFILKPVFILTILILLYQTESVPRISEKLDIKQSSLEFDSYTPPPDNEESRIYSTQRRMNKVQLPFGSKFKSKSYHEYMTGENSYEATNDDYYTKKERNQEWMMSNSQYTLPDISYVKDPYYYHAKSNNMSTSSKHHRKTQIVYFPPPRNPDRIGQQLFGIVNITQQIDHIDIVYLNTINEYQTLAYFMWSALSYMLSRTIIKIYETDFNLVGYDIIQPPNPTSGSILLHYSIHLYGSYIDGSIDYHIYILRQTLDNTIIDGSFTTFFQRISNSNTALSSSSFTIIPTFNFHVASYVLPNFLDPINYETWSLLGYFNVTQTFDNDYAYLDMFERIYYLDYYNTLKYLAYILINMDSYKNGHDLIIYPYNATSVIFTYSVPIYGPTDDPLYLPTLLSKWKLDISLSVSTSYVYTINKYFHFFRSSRMYVGIPLFPTVSSRLALDMYYATYGGDISTYYIQTQDTRVPVLPPIIIPTTSDVILSQYTPLNQVWQDSFYGYMIILIEAEFSMPLYSHLPYNSSIVGPLDFLAQSLRQYAPPSYLSYRDDYVVTRYIMVDNTTQVVSHNIDLGRPIATVRKIVSVRINDYFLCNAFYFEACIIGINHVKNGLLPDFVSGIFQNYLQTNYPIEASQTSFVTKPLIYLVTHPPLAQVDLIVTQILDNILPLNLSLIEKRIQLMTGISTAVHSFLPEVNMTDVKVSNIRLLTGQSYEVIYHVSPRFDLNYGTLYADTYQQLLTSSVQSGAFTKQLQLASSVYYYNVSQLSGGTSTITPTYQVKYIGDNATHDTNEKHVGTLNITQSMTGVDLLLLNTTSGYQSFVTIFSQAMAALLPGVLSSDVHVYNYVLLNETSSGVGSISVSYSLDLYSTNTNVVAVSTLTEVTNYTINEAMLNSKCTFQLNFISAAISHNMTSLITIQVDNPPTIVTSIAAFPISTSSPSTTPVISPTLSPVISPTLSPTTSPSLSPSRSPTLLPTQTPTVVPTNSPTLGAHYHIGQQVLRVLNITQNIDNINVNTLNTTAGYNSFSTILRQGILDVLYPVFSSMDVYVTPELHLQDINIISYQVINGSTPTFSSIAVKYSIDIYWNYMIEEISVTDHILHIRSTVSNSTIYGIFTTKVRSHATAQGAIGYTTVALITPPTFTEEPPPSYTLPNYQNRAVNGTWIYMGIFNVTQRVDNVTTSSLLSESGYTDFYEQLIVYLYYFVINGDYYNHTYALNIIPHTKNSVIISYSISIYAPPNDPLYVPTLLAKWRKDLSDAVSTGFMSIKAASQGSIPMVFTQPPLFSSISGPDAIHLYYGTYGSSGRTYYTQTQDIRTPILPPIIVPTFKDVYNTYYTYPSLILIDTIQSNVTILLEVDQLLSLDDNLFNLETEVSSYMETRYDLALYTEYSLVDTVPSQGNTIRYVLKMTGDLKENICTTLSCYMNSTKYMRDRIIQAFTEDTFVTTFQENYPDMSSISFLNPPMVYLSSYPPAADVNLKVTQRLDNILPLSSLSVSKNNAVKDAIEAVIKSVLIEVQLADIKVSDILLISGQSYDVVYYITLHFDSNYGEIYADTCKLILTSAVQSGIFTSQLRLASSIYYYDISQLSGVTSTITPTYQIKQVGVNATHDVSEQKVSTLNMTQSMTGVDLQYLNTTSGYQSFVTIFTQALAALLPGVLPQDIIIYGYIIIVTKSRRILTTGGSISLEYGINLYSTSNDTSTVSTITADTSSSINNAVSSGIFTNSFTSAAVNNGASDYTTITATTPSTNAPITQQKASTASTPSSFSLVSGGGIAILVIIIIIPLIALFLLSYYIRSKSTTTNGTTHLFFPRIYPRVPADGAHTHFNESFDFRRLVNS